MAIDFSSDYERHGVGIAVRAEKRAQPLVVEFIGLVLNAQNFFADARRNDETFRAIGNSVQFKHLDLTYCSYSTAVRLTFPASDLVREQFPLSGGGQTGFGRSQFSVNANETCIVAAGADVSFDFKADFAQLILRIDADALQNMLNALVGWPVSRNIEFLGPSRLENPRLLYLRGAI
jgi:hypothetical protein